MTRTKRVRKEISKEELLNNAVPSLVNHDTFMALYDDAAHISYGDDIDIVFQLKFRIEDEEYPDAIVSAVITNESLKVLDMSIGDLFLRAMENIEGTFQVQELNGLLTKMIDAVGAEPLSEDAEEGSKMMYVLTTKYYMNGAAAMLSPSALEMAAKAAGGDYYLIPSSIHELLVIKDTKELDPRFLMRVIREVNRGVVSPWEVLTDNLYRYSCKYKAVTKVEEPVYA